MLNVLNHNAENTSSIKQQRQKLLLVIAGLLTLYMTGNYSGILQGRLLSWWSDLFWTFAALATAGRCMLTAKKRSMPQEQKAWYLFGLAACSWFVGMLIWDYYEIFGGELTPFPSIGDWFFMGYAVFFTAGLFYYRTHTPTRQYNMIQVANLGLMICSIIVICFVLLSQVLQHSHHSVEYEFYALSHAILTIACFVFGMYCYWFYVWRENRQSFRLMLAALFIFAVTDTLYAFQLLGQSFDASSYLNIYWLIALALQYWAAFEQDTVTETPSAEIETFSTLKAPKYEALMPALCLFSVLTFIVFSKQQLDNNILTVIACSTIAFTFFLALREWYSNSLETSLLSEIQTGNQRLADAQHMAHLGHWEQNLVTDTVDWSNEIYRIFGIERHQNKDPHAAFVDAIHPDDRSHLQQTLHDTLQQGTSYEVEYRIIRHDGVERFLYSQAELTRGVNRQPLRLNGIIQDITERKQAERLLQRNNQTQALINKLLNASLADQPLSEFLQYAIEQLTQSTIISLAEKGAIFLTNDQGDSLEMVAQHNLNDELLDKCHYLPFGKCLCGTAASTQSIQFYSCVDQHHEITFEGMQPHGHYCIPILSNESVLGVINLYLIHGHQQSESEIEFLKIIANSLANIIERKLAENALVKLSRAVESSSSAVYITDAEGLIEYINPKFSEITGYSEEEVLGKTPRFLKTDETPMAVYEDMWQKISSGEEWKAELQNRKKDGSLYWARTSISGVRNANEKFTHYIAIQDDVTREYKMSEQISYQASHDMLTGLINRHEFERRAERLLSTFKPGVDDHAFCFMDLDQFKIINDSCGHAAGDELLRQIGRLLKGTIRKRDTLSRLGGDEFGIIMELCTLDQAHRVASSILKSVQDFLFIWEGQSFRVGISIGLVTLSEANSSLTELLKQADAACYMAKDSGRNRIHVYHPEDTEMLQRHGVMQWVARINKALEENRFCLYAQPIVPLDGSGDKHYELLLRMVDDDGSIIPPGSFLPAAERYNLIEKLDVWVIKNAFSMLASHPGFTEQIQFLSINLSGPSLTNHSFLEFIMTQLREFNIDASKICFEVTETVAISNLNAAISFISILKEIGCRFALDDFGSGLSSFAYLKNLPVNYLKIDGMFVKDIVDDPIDRAMVKSINDIGHVMGMQTVAEFVENDQIRDMLMALGIDYAQGYGPGKPEPFKAILTQSEQS